MDKGIIPVPNEVEQDDARLHHTTQNNTQYKNYKLFISEFFIKYFWTVVTMNNKLGMESQIRVDYCTIYGNVLVN